MTPDSSKDRSPVDRLVADSEKLRADLLLMSARLGAFSERLQQEVGKLHEASSDRDGETPDEVERQETQGHAD